jgi:phage-related minor tail protein
MFASIEWRRDLQDFADSLGLAGDAAVTTADRARDFAQAIGDATRFTREQALGESTSTRQLRQSISADSFERVNVAAADLATAMRQDLGSAAEQLGRALERPEQAAAMLRRANVFLSESQQELIADFMEFGDLASAQEVVLQQIEDSMGGLARQVTTNDSAFDKWSDAIKAASESRWVIHYCRYSTN